MLALPFRSVLTILCWITYVHTRIRFQKFPSPLTVADWNKFLAKRSVPGRDKDCSDTLTFCPGRPWKRERRSRGHMPTSARPWQLPDGTTPCPEPAYKQCRFCFPDERRAALGKLAFSFFLFFVFSLLEELESWWVTRARHKTGTKELEGWNCSVCPCENLH